MNAQDNGGPAFPQTGEQFNHDIGEREVVTTHAGMTLRDYFAAKAMQALVRQRCYPHDQMVGQFAYMIADLMLKARAA